MKARLSRRAFPFYFLQTGHSAGHQVRRRTNKSPIAQQPSHSTAARAKLIPSQDRRVHLPLPSSRS
jgi:hypothetical protein